MTDDSRLNELEPYLPSSSERKQAVMMYMVSGLFLSLGKREVSPFIHHHIKQSFGWLVFMVLIIFTDLALAILGMILSFFGWIAVLITIPSLTIGAMGINQATKGKYIWETEFGNKFFAFFSGIGNRVLNLFDADNYQIIDEERYRDENQFYPKNNKKENTETTQANQTINNSTSDGKTLDNNQQNVISNQNIGIDLSGHEINNPENQINN